MSLRPTHISPTKTRSQPGSKLWRLGRRGHWDPDFVRHILLLMLKPDSQGPQMQMNAFRCLLKSCARLYFFSWGEGYTHSYQPPQGEAECHLESHFPNGFFHLEQLVLTVHQPHGQRRLRPLSAWGCITSTQTVAMTDRPRDPPRGRQVGPSPHHIHSNIERQCPLTANSEAPTLHRWDTLGYNVHSERLQIFFFFSGARERI